MRKIDVKDLGSIQLVAKFVCKNSIVMYHLIVNSANVFVPACMFDSWMQYLDIELTGMSDIQRVNVSESGNRYVIRDDSNSRALKFKYASSFTGVPSDMQLLAFTQRALNQHLHKVSGKKLLSYFKHHKFIKISSGVANSREIDGMHMDNLGVIEITDTIETKRSKDGYIHYNFKNYIMANDLVTEGISESDINIVGTLYVNLTNGCITIDASDVSVRPSGWYIQETSRMFVGYFNKGYRPNDYAFKQMQEMASKVPNDYNGRDIDMSGVFFASITYLRNQSQYLAHTTDDDITRLFNKGKTPIKYKVKCHTKEEYIAAARHELAAINGDTSRFEQLMRKHRNIGQA